MTTFILGVALFTLIVLALVTIIMLARSRLVSTTLRSSPASFFSHLPLP